MQPSCGRGTGRSGGARGLRRPARCRRLLDTRPIQTLCPSGSLGEGRGCGVRARVQKSRTGADRSGPGAPAEKTDRTASGRLHFRPPAPCSRSRASLQAAAGTRKPEPGVADLRVPGAGRAAGPRTRRRGSAAGSAAAPEKPARRARHRQSSNPKTACVRNTGQKRHRPNQTRASRYAAKRRGPALRASSRAAPQIRTRAARRGSGA